MIMKKHIAKITAVILFFFGLLTLFLSSSIIFDLFDIRAKEGNYVSFIVWANFISSILYLFASYGLLKNKWWSTLLLGIASIILIVSFIGLKMYINAGGIYETKTVSAMIFRTTLTLVFTAIAYRYISKNSTTKFQKS